MRNYRELVAWQVGFQLASRVYALTNLFPKSEEFGLKSQLRRAAVSIPSNLAEGAGRASRKEFAQFVTIARGSLNELETQLLLAEELGCGPLDQDMLLEVERRFGLLNGLGHSLNADRSTPNTQPSTLNPHG